MIKEIPRKAASGYLALVFLPLLTVGARRQIVDGTVGMVDMALRDLAQMNVVEPEEGRKANMVSNLLVVLCGKENAWPVLNAGSLYS